MVGEVEGLIPRFHSAFNIKLYHVTFLFSLALGSSLYLKQHRGATGEAGPSLLMKLLKGYTHLE